MKDVALSVRRPAALIGLGLLEAVPGEAIEKIAEENGGEVSRVGDAVGRFGWKASQPTVRATANSTVNGAGRITAEKKPGRDRCKALDRGTKRPQIESNDQFI